MCESEMARCAYWPNAGYGVFWRQKCHGPGALVDHPDAFNSSESAWLTSMGRARSINLLGRDKISFWLNQAETVGVARQLTTSRRQII